MSVQSQAAAERFLGILTREQHLSSGLLGLLKTEATVLAESNLHDLERIAIAKQELAVQVNQQVQLHNLLLREWGLPETREGTDQLIRWVENHTPHVRELWAEVKKLAADCRHQNDINGQMVEMARRNTEKAIEVIAYRQESKKPVYGRSGQLRAATGSQTLGKA